MTLRTRRLLVVLAGVLTAAGALPLLLGVGPTPAATSDGSFPGDRFLQLVEEFHSKDGTTAAPFIDVAVKLFRPNNDPVPGQAPTSGAADSTTGPIRIGFDIESRYGNGFTDLGSPDGFCTVLVGSDTCSVRFHSGGDKFGVAQIRAWIDADGITANEGGVDEADVDEARYAGPAAPSSSGSDDCISAGDTPSDSACRTSSPAGPGLAEEPDVTDVGLINFFIPSSSSLTCAETAKGRAGTQAEPIAIGRTQNLTVRCRANFGSSALANNAIDGELLRTDRTDNGPNDPDGQPTEADNVEPDYKSEDNLILGKSGCVTDASGTCTFTISGAPGQSGVALLCFWIDGTRSPATQDNEYNKTGPAADGGGCDEVLPTGSTAFVFVFWQDAVGLDAQAETASVEKGTDTSVTARVYATTGNPSVASPKPVVYAERFLGSVGDTDGNAPATADLTFPAIAAGQSTTILTIPTPNAGTLVLCVWTAQTPTMTGRVGGTGADTPTCTNASEAGEPATDPTGNDGTPTPITDNTDVVTRTITEPPAPPPVPQGSGYWILEASGRVGSFNATDYGSGGLTAPAVGIASKKGTTKGGDGYWIVGSDGSVAAKGSASNFGNATNVNLAQPIVGLAARPQGDGYWLLGRDGGIFSYGPGARFHGSTGGITLNKPVVGITATQSGNGYWLVASDGGIFAFGDAFFAGSMGDKPLNKPVVGMTAPASGGYLLVASDGGLFAFGGARFFGSMGDKTIVKPVVGMTSREDGNGYWEVAEDGGLFSFNTPFHGSLAGRATSPVVGMASFGSV